MPGHGLIRWILPDAAAIVFLFAVCWVLFAGDGAARLFRDSDTGWHIRTGEALLRGSPLPRTDPYSFTKAGEVWFAWEWGADVAMGALHREGGLRLVALGFALIGSTAVWLAMRVHWLVGGNFFLACALAAPLMTTMGLHWLARPHVVSWLMAVAALWLCERGSNGFAPPGWMRLGVFALFGACWANLHASFFFLPGLAAVYAAGSLAGAMLWDKPRQTGWFLAAAVSAMMGTLVNPYGWQLHLHVARYLSDRELLQRIGEYQSFNFHAEGAEQILLTVALVLMGAPLMLWRRRPEHFLLCCGLAALALRSARALPLLALLALPLVNGALTEALAHVDLRPRLRRTLDAFLAYSQRLRLLDEQAGGPVTVTAVLMLAFVLLHAPAISARTGFPAAEFPVKAASAVAQLPADARLLAPDKFGGYLIYRFDGQRKVFFDGRSDFYGLAFLKRYIRLMEARPGWREEVKAFGFTHALLPVNYSLVAGLTDWGWRELYRDETAILLVRN